MDSMLGFNDEAITFMDVENQNQQQTSYKLVPWLNWEEWERVRDSLFSASPQSITFALNRISTWRSRGCLPVVVDVTASFIEIQEKDPFFRKDLPIDSIHSEQMLAMLYSMAILRLVNCVIEKTRKKTEISIAEAAHAIGIPRTLIDIRHEGSHRDLPALSLVRDAAVKAIHWLKSYYWDRQTKQIPFQKDGTAALRKEIKTKLRELVSCIRYNMNPHSVPVSSKGRRAKYCEQICGRSKFFSIMSSKVHSSKSMGKVTCCCSNWIFEESIGSKKQITKILKSLVRLYSSFSSELLSELLESLLRALSSSDSTEVPNGDQIVRSTNTLLGEWKLVITKLADKEPEVLLMLLKATLNMIETKEEVKYGKEYGTGACEIERLSSLLLWLVEQLKALKTSHSEDGDQHSSSGMNISNAILTEALRKCLLLSSYGNKQLVQSAQHLALIMGRSSLVEKINRLSLLTNSDVTEESTTPSSLQGEELIHQASKKLEMIELSLRSRKIVKKADANVVSSGRWIVAKSWNPCPIGMLPRELGSSGRHPILDHNDDEKGSVDSSEQKCICEEQHNDERDLIGDVQLLDSPDVVKSGSKRISSLDICLLDASNTKKTKQTAGVLESDEEALLSKSVKGRLMIDGVWKPVGGEELLAIQSEVSCWF